MMFPGEMKLKPQTPEEEKDVETCDGIRRRLQKYAHLGSNPLVHSVYTLAEAHGLSGEDKMTMLAYQALLQAEQLTATIIDSAMNEPIRLLIPKERSD